MPRNGPPHGLRLFLVRHGKAEPGEVDSHRALTERGKKDARRMAHWAAAMKFHVDEIRHSGKVRAEQTADIFAATLAPPGGLVSDPRLAPDDDVRPFAEWLKERTGTLLLVGHEPFLSRLAGYLVLRDDQSILRFKTGGVALLDREAEGWSAVCLMQPEFVKAGEHAGSEEG